MPFIDIDTNVKLGDKDADILIDEMTDVICSVLGKPKSHIVVTLRDGLRMGFATRGNCGVMITVRSVGFGNKAQELVHMVSELTARELEVDMTNVNVNLVDIPMSTVGKGGRLLG